MPGFNQTGPMGQGSMTGRKMGKCTNFGANQQQKTTDEQQTAETVEMTGRGMRRGCGCKQRGQGQGFGRGNRRGNGVNN